MLSELVDAGLPHAGTADDALFDDNDLGNMSLYLGLKSSRRMAMLCWIRALRRIRQGGARYTVSLRVSCTYPGHVGLCVYQVHPAFGGIRTATGTRADTTVAELTTPDLPCPVDLPRQVVQIANRFSDVSFHLLPRPLKDDLSLLHREKIGECSMTAKALISVLLEAGFPARLAFGLILATPFSSTHTWAEIQVDDQWLPVDPLLPRALQSWGIVRPADWPVTMSPRGLFYRLTGEQTDFARHAGYACRQSLPTTVAGA
ncbi:transglutaminase domain-containing protein [Nonomuraea sp. SMC257]|uniref:Transglutaminase domain-containing protein n=1 Tax=Nonomuraea montanisoli TaxID=2741721 RepID=A0A7Y6M5E2_9ACTN|nr:transglutaminase-like domain-containing protein [Nonomuraea montanisoli]NUW34546.1 transglutaminase domain-containing protein [Nonomuraea montanisoli]